MFLRFFLTISVSLSLYANDLHEKVRKVHSHLLIDDPVSALKQSQDLVNEYPESKEAMEVHVLALASNGFEEKALKTWDALSFKDPNLAADRNLLEDLAWGFLKKGMNSTQYAVRLSALIGAFLTQDAKAVPYIAKMLRDSNAVVRAVAVQMSTQYGDAILKDEIQRLLKEEKVWMVRLEVIKAIGVLRMKECSSSLESIIKSDKTTYEERLLSIESLCQMYDSITYSQWKVFAHSNRAGFRHFACNMAVHFKLESAKNDLLRMLQDSHPDVKIAAINAFGLYFKNLCTTEEIEKSIRPILQDSNADVAISACWAAQVAGLDCLAFFESWLKDSVCEYRRLAARALSATGPLGVPLATKMLKESSDPYVLANLSIGLIGQRAEVDACCNVIHRFLEDEKRMFMWDTRQNPLFEVLCPSQVRYVDHIPNYPESIDHMTRLNLLSLLAVVDDQKALQSVKSFLKKKSWGITGVAAATLLQEGDESTFDVVKQLIDDSDPDVRLQACFVLAMFGRDESVIDELQKAYAVSSHERKLHILEAMGRIGSIQNFHFLLSALKEPFPVLKIAAAAALIQSIHR